MTVAMVPYAATEPSPGQDDDGGFGDIGPGECFCARFHTDMSMLAASYADGTIRVFDPAGNKPEAEHG